MPLLSILHTCDLHGRWNDSLVDTLRELRRERPGGLLLDCGDALGVGNLNPGWGCGSTVERMNAAGFDAMAMGNRETHLWWPAVRGKLRGLRFPVLSTNLVQPRPPVQRWTIREAGGFRIGLFALTPVMTSAGGPFTRVVSVTFAAPLSSAMEAVVHLRPRVELLVCLSHLGHQFDRTLAKAVPGIDVILGGHDHSPGLPEGEKVAACLLARSSPYGENVGEVSVCIGETGIGRISMSARLLSYG